MKVTARSLKSGHVIVDGKDRHAVVGISADPATFMGGYEGMKLAMRIELDGGRVLFPVYPAHQFKVI